MSDMKMISDQSDMKVCYKSGKEISHQSDKLIGYQEWYVGDKLSK